MKPLRIFTPVFGPKHIKLLDRALGRSFMWPKNHEAISKAKWTLFIHQSEFEQVMTVATKILPEEQIETIEDNGSLSDLIAWRGVLMCEALVKVMRKCIEEKTPMLMATPDFIWADGTISNMIQLAKQPGACVALPHPRVLPETLDTLDYLDHPMSSPDLVRVAMAHPHKSWTTSELGKHHGTPKGGILWRKMGPGLITLAHRMPSPYLVNFVSTDIDFFTSNTSEKRAAFGAWDHDWASHLIQQQRWRQILSSDVGFMAEVTSPEDNVPPWTPMNTTTPDDFWLQERTDHLFNQKIGRQYISTFRWDESNG